MADRAKNRQEKEKRKSTNNYKWIVENKVKYNLVSQYKVEEANKVLMGISNNKYHFIKHYDS